MACIAWLNGIDVARSCGDGVDPGLSKQSRAGSSAPGTGCGAYRVAWPSANACDHALQDFVYYKLSHNLGLLDALIAHTAIELGAPLYTFNQKHYTAIPALTTIQPYTKMTT